jgi:hypothetical protein
MDGGASGVAGAAEGSVMAGADVSASGPDVEGAATEAQDATSGSAVQGRVSAQAGPAESIASGSAERNAREEADNAAAQADVSYQADVASEGVANAEANAKIDARDGAIGAAGVQGEVNTYNDVQAEKSHREGQVREAEAIKADPSGSAETAARGEADARIAEATPQRVTDAKNDVSQAEADARFAQDAANNPVGTAEAEADVKIEGEVGFDLPPKK